VSEKTNGIASSAEWRLAAQSARRTRAERLRLPSGTAILAARPDPLEWIMSGRLPQRLLAAALESEHPGPEEAELSRQDVLDLARFAMQLVKASVVEPAIGEGPEEISLDDIPLEDRAFIFQWACRALSQSPAAAADAVSNPSQEDLSSDKLERFRQE
jgi:hypothetical protein